MSSPLFTKHKEKIEKALIASIPSFGEKTLLRDACAYALVNGGKRFRPLIVLLVAEALGHGLEVMPAALAVEFFHTASLIADDLPCMDNEEERRQKPTVHKVYGESIALLASYALITAGFEGIYQNSVRLQEALEPFSSRSDKAGLLALQSASICSGIRGATGGQFLDLYPPDQSWETIQEVLYKKTITLFEVSFLFGWLFGGGDLEKIDPVKKVAYHLGMAFQIADDLGDMLQDEKNQRAINSARCLGKEKALSFFHEEIRALKTSLRDLHLDTPAFQEMVVLLVQLASSA